MTASFLSVLDQLRYICGLLAACFLFCRRAAVKRERFPLRATVGCACAILLALLYVIIYPRMAALPTAAFLVSLCAYWLWNSYFVCTVIWFCYRVSLGEALFRGLLGASLESFVTTLLRYILVMMFFPRLPENHTAAYILLSLGIYAGIYAPVYFFLAKPMQQYLPGTMDSHSDAVNYALALLIFSLLLDASNGVCEWLTVPIGTYNALHTEYTLIRWFCIGVRLAISTILFLLLNNTYRINVLNSERLRMDQILSEKAEQYQRSKETIELINRKCHDLKHLLLALEVAGGQERQSIMEETKKAVMIYDTSVNTGNEVLDTLLTEKSTVCADRNIRLSCSVQAPHLNVIRVVDLYTMLGNAIDNAIECVTKYQDPDKKTIALSIGEQGSMLLIAVENYFDDQLTMNGGYPATTKADKGSHGIGVRSIDMVSRSYGGCTRISTENQSFLLQIMLPIGAKG